MRSMTGAAIVVSRFQGYWGHAQGDHAEAGPLSMQHKAEKRLNTAASRGIDIRHEEARKIG